MTEHHIRLHRSRNNRSPSTREQIRIKPPLLGCKVIQHIGEQPRSSIAFMHRASKESKLRVFEGVFVLKCDEKLFDASSLETRGRSWDHMFDSVFNYEAVSGFESDAQPDFDEECVANQLQSFSVPTKILRGPEWVLAQCDNV